MLGAKYNMRFNEVKKLIESDQDLFEINMSPSNLDKLSRQIPARAGMEFEMIVPDVTMSGADDFEPEPDYDYDESATSIDDIVNFFNHGDQNSSRAVRALRDALEEVFNDWVGDAFSDRWSSDAEEFIYQYLRDNAGDDDIVEILELSGGEAQEVLDTGATKQDYIKAADVVLQTEDSWYNDAYQDAYEDFKNSSSVQEEWLAHEGIHSMTDVLSDYNIEWPYWTEYDNENDEANLEEVADSFSYVVGKPVTASESYHGAVRSPGRYIVEPDSSLSPDGDNEMGLEFVSPPMPLPEMFDDLDKVKRWADDRGCYTNSSTGLHINVSIQDKDLSKLDYVKLALLMGDKYVLEQFNRLGNRYAKSAMDIITQRVSQRPEDAEMMLQSMKNKLGDLATKIIHSGATDKYTSINTKSKYIEFRSPGGNWLDDEFFNKVKPTLMRFVVAMDAAMDPQKYREEYLKKLYTLLAPKGKEDTLSYFARFAAGELPKAALKSFVKQAQLERKLEKDPLGGQTWWWNVPYNGQRIEVVAANKKEAKLVAAQEWGLTPRQAEQIIVRDIRPIRPYEETPTQAPAQGPVLNGRPSNPDGRYVILSTLNNDPPYYRFDAADNADAENVVRQWERAHPGQQWDFMYDPYQRAGQPPVPGSTIDLQRQRAAQSRSADDLFSEFRGILSQTDVENRLGWGSQEADANYEVVHRSTMRPVFKFIANTEPEAARKYAQWLDQQDLPQDTEDYGFRPIQQSQQPQAPMGGQNFPRTPNQPATRSMVPGRELRGWKIVLPDGREVHRFSGAGNNQGDANRIAAEWLRNNNMGVSGEGFEVVPWWEEA